MAIAIFTMATLLGFFVNTIMAIVFGYQLYSVGLDNAHKAIFAGILFSLAFFAAILIFH